MASIAMTTSFLGGSATAVATKQPSASTPRRGVVIMAKASKVNEVEKVAFENKNIKEESNNGRRDMMFAVAAAAACSIAKVAMADDEPKRGSQEAKKKYGSICVTMPTARICRY